MVKITEETVVRINPAELVNVQFLFYSQIWYHGVDSGYRDSGFHELLDERFTLPTDTDEIGDIRTFLWDQPIHDSTYHVYFGYDHLIISVNARNIHLDPAEPIQSFSNGVTSVLEQIEELREYFIREVCSGGETELKPGTLIVNWQNLDTHEIPTNTPKQILSHIVNHVKESCSGEVYGYRATTPVRVQGTATDSRYQEAIICEDIKYYPSEPIPIFAKNLALLRLRLYDCQFENIRIYKEQDELKKTIEQSKQVNFENQTKFNNLTQRLDQLKVTTPEIRSKLRNREDWSSSPLEDHPDKGLFKIDGRKRFPVHTIGNLIFPNDLLHIVEQLDSDTFYCNELHDLGTTIENLRNSKKEGNRKWEFSAYLLLFLLGLPYTPWHFSMLSEPKALTDTIGILADYIQIITFFVLLSLLYRTRHSID